jgi:hypothetical protein
MVEHQFSKLMARVRFPYPAHILKRPAFAGCFYISGRGIRESKVVEHMNERKRSECETRTGPVRADSTRRAAQIPTSRADGASVARRGEEWGRRMSAKPIPFANKLRCWL